MNPNCKYEVHTYWGWFRLDEGAYQDYLAGKLWITWVPGKPNQSHPVGSDPVHVSDEALKYRELAARSDAYTVCYQFFATGKATVPYHSKMSDTPIDEMCLSVRSSNGLMRAGANTFGKVKEIMERENGLRTIRNLGVKSEKEIKLCFFNSCYLLLNEYEKAEWWQEVHSAAHSGRWCGGPAAAVCRCVPQNALPVILRISRNS